MGKLVIINNPGHGGMLAKLGLWLLVPWLLVGCGADNDSVALGTLERDRIALTATASEIITAIKVKQGQQVSQGQVLLQLDTTEQQARVNQAQAQAASAKAHLQQLENGARAEDVAAAQARVAGAQATLANAEKTYRRFLALVNKEVLSKADLDEALAQRDAARANLKDAREQLLVLVNGTRPEQLAQAQADLAAANYGLAAEQKKLQDLTIKASRDGVIDDLPWHLGERVTMGSPVVILLANQAPYARVYVPASKRAAMQPGDQFKVRVDGVAGSFTGTLRQISSDPAFTPYYALSQKDRARLVYLAEIQLGEAAKQLPVGIPAQVMLP
jgi:HlyD family secretion protein